MSNIPSQCKFHFGIDVSKDTLDIHNLETGQYWQLPNTPSSIKSFLGQERGDLAQAFVVVDMAGGYERYICDLFITRSICLHRAHPYRVKCFIRSCGQLAKTDKIDARMLARYGVERKHDLVIYQPLERHQQALKGLVERRFDLVNTQTQEKNRMQSPAANELVMRSCNALIKVIKMQIKHIEVEIDKLVRADEQNTQKAKTLAGLTGIGPQTTRTLIALMPELGTMTGKQAASLAGLAPRANDSGKGNAYRFIKGGRPQIRRTMFMAALSAVRYDENLSAHYQNMIKRGKKPIVAVTAIARKIIVIANARIRDNVYLIN